MYRSRCWSIRAVAALMVLPGLSVSAQGGPCDPNYVQAKHKQILVLPTGGDDTANLQCALNLGATRSPGVTVELSAGTFHTAQLVIQGLRGLVRGMGQKRTIVQNLDTPLPIDNRCIDSGPCFNQAPPSPTNRHPVLISVIGQHVTLSDMTFDIVGTKLTVPWQIPGVPMMVECLNPIVQLIGSHALLDVSRLSFKGAPYAWDPDTGGFVGPVGDVYVWSGLDPAPVTNSTLVVTESTFVFGGVWAYNVDRSRVFVGWNRFRWSVGNPMGTTLSDVRDSSVVYAHNEFDVSVPGASGLVAWPGNLGTGLTRTRLFIANNTFAGDAAITFVPGSFTDVTCLAVNNDVSDTVTPYAWDNTSTPCRVVGGHPKQ